MYAIRSYYEKQEGRRENDKTVENSLPSYFYDPVQPYNGVSDSLVDWSVITSYSIHYTKLYDAAIPDFGGFLVKADSENRPGPFTYGRNHAEGAAEVARELRPRSPALVRPARPP